MVVLKIEEGFFSLEAVKLSLKELYRGIVGMVFVERPWNFSQQIHTQKTLALHHRIEE